MILLSLFYTPIANASTNPVDLKINVETSDIGFITVGDKVPVTVTVTNNTNETKYFVISAILRPDRLPPDGFDGDKLTSQEWIDAYTTMPFNFTFVARYPELWWLIIDANGYETTEQIGIVVGRDNSTAYYIHPSSDRDTRLLAQSTLLLAQNAKEIPITTWLLVIAAIASAGGAVGFGYYQAKTHRTNLRLTAMMQIFELLSKDPTVGNRRFLYQEYWKRRDEGQNPVLFDRSSDVRSKADQVMGAFDKAALMVNSGLVDKEEFFRIYHWMVLQFWVVAEGDLMTKQRRNPHAGEHFRKLALEYIDRLKMLPIIYRRQVLPEEPKD